MLSKTACTKRLNLFLKQLDTQPFLAFLTPLQAEYPYSRTYLVGGIVRDVMLKRTSTDYDLVVSGIPGEELFHFLEQHGTVHLVGKKFGVYKFNPKETPDKTIDIALPRKDFSFGTGKHQDVTIQTDPALPIEEDLSRRDFTINAMAIDLTTKTLIDPFQGQTDLMEEKIKTVGKPEERFQEDYVRLLRALRFSCQLKFSIEEHTWNILKTFVPKLNQTNAGERMLPAESIAKELCKAFATNPMKAIVLLDESGAMQELLPELTAMKGCQQPHAYHTEGDVWTHTVLAIQNTQSPEFKREFKQTASVETIFATLFHDIGKPPTQKTPEKDGSDRIRFDGHDQVGATMTTEICQRLRLSSPEHYGIDTDRVSWVVRNHLLLVMGKVKDIKNTTLEKYFFNPKVAGDTLRQIMFVDGMASIKADGKPGLENYRQLKRRLKTLLEKQKQPKLPEALLDGQEIMDALKIQAGPKIGEVKDALREQQLAQNITTKEEALNFVKGYNV